MPAESEFADDDVAPASDFAIIGPSPDEAYRTSDSRPRLHRSYVFLLDLLGTSNSTQSDADITLEVTYRAVQRANKSAGRLGNVRVRWFSDNVIVSAPDDADAAFELNGAAAILVVAAMQLEFAMEGLFLRGGGHIGDFYIDDTFAFGPALVRAHDLEDRVAVYPRVVVSAEFDAYLRARSAGLNGAFPDEIYRNMLAIDHDGMTFVDYLAMSEDLGRDSELEWFANHRVHITSSIKQHTANDRVRPKYAWSADYHDRYMRWYLPGHPRLPELLVGDPDGPSITPFLSRPAPA